MKLKHIVPSLLAACIVAVALTACESEKEDEHEGKKESEAQLKAEAKVSEADARATALAKVPNGTIKEAELEKEHGNLIWSFDVATPDTKDITEVNVNAITGAIVNVEHETPAQQAREANEEKKEKDDDKK